jgi:hypothetical protein
MRSGGFLQLKVLFVHILAWGDTNRIHEPTSAVPTVYNLVFTPMMTPLLCASDALLFLLPRAKGPATVDVSVSPLLKW